MKVDARLLYSEMAKATPPPFFPIPPVPVRFNFDQGIAAEETFPLDDLKRLAVEVLERDEGRALEYHSFGYDATSETNIYQFENYPELVYGHTGLRELVAAWIQRVQRVQDLGPDNLILTSGSSQGISLALDAFVNPGDGVLVEAATFPFAMRFIRMRGADLRTVAMDADGMNTDALEHRLREFQRIGVRPKLLYIIATFNLPTGLILSEARRRRLIEIAQEWNLVILEDAIYSDLRYDGDPVPSLLSLDDSGLVIQCHAFSKIVAPALRLGWVCGSREMVSGLDAVRQDLGVSQWLCRLMARFIAEGKLDPHIERANRVYRRKRDLAAAAVRKYCGDWVEFDLPQGSFYLWLQLHPDVDWDKARAAAAMGGRFLQTW
jgi:2-aminoadipate transaminase